MAEKYISYNLSVLITKQGKSFVAYSPVLDLSTVGKTEMKAKKMFVEAVSLFFEELIERNTLNEVLVDLGWQKVKKVWNPPKVSNVPMQIRVPALV